MTGALAGEWTKLATLRSPWWTAVLAVIGFGGIATMIAFTADADIRPVHLVGGASLGMLIAMVIGVLAATGDHSTGTYRLSVMADSNRARLFAAKAVIVALISALVATVGSAVLALAALSSPQVLGDWNAADMRGVWGQAAVWALAGVLAVSVGTLVRRTAFSVAAVMLWPILVEPMIQLIPKIGEPISRWTPFNNAIMFTNPSQFGPAFELNAPAVALAIFAAYALGLAVITAVVESRRDA